MKRKLLKLLILTIIVSICVLIIYKLFHQNKINVVVLGDNNEYSIYLKDTLSKNKTLGTYNIYTDKNETIDSLTTKINTTSSIKKDLRESKLTTISIGLNDFYNLKPSIDTKTILNLKDKISILLPKLDKLLELVRKYAKYEIVLIGYYNQEPFLFNTNQKELDVLFLYIDSMVKDIVKKYNIRYIPLYDIVKNNPNNINLTISNEIIKNVKQKI